MKQYSGQVLCSSSGISVTVTIPANGRATVRLPYNAAKGTAGIVVSETGTGNALPVFSNGAFVPGVPGVFSAVLSTATSSVEVEVGGGQYAFQAIQ